MHFVFLTLQTRTGSFVQWRVMLFAGFFRFWNGTGYMFFSFPFLSVFWARLAQVPSSSDASCSHYASVGILFFEFETESVSCSFSFSIFYIFCVRLATRSSDDPLFMLSGQGSHRLRHLVTHHSLIMPLLEFCFESETESVSCSFSFSSFYIFWVRLATRSLNDHFFLIFLSSYMLVFEAFRRDGHVDVSQGSRCSAVAMVTGRARAQQAISVLRTNELSMYICRHA